MRLKIKDFGVIEDLTFDLVPGLTVLSAPNGCGKSTVVDALFFALSGELMSGVNVAERISWSSLTKTASVELSADDFCVCRRISGDSVSHTLKLPDSEKICRKADINAWILRRFHLSTFAPVRDIFFSPQLQATTLLDATMSARLSMLSGFFNLDGIEKARGTIMKVLTDNVLEVVSAESLESVRTGIANDEAEQRTHIARNVELRQQKSEINYDPKTYDRILSAPLEGETEVYSRRLQKLTDDLKTFEADLAERQKTFDRIRELRGFRDGKISFDSYQERLAAAQKSVADQGEISPSVKQLRDLERPILNAIAGIDAEVSDVQRRSSQIQNGVCPLTGGTPCIELLRASDGNIVADKLKDLADRKAAAETDLRGLQDLILTTEVRESELSIALRRLESVLSETVPDTPTDFSIDELERLEKDNPHADEELARARAMVQTQTSEIKTAEDWINAHKGSECSTQEERNHQQKLRTANDAVDAELRVTASRIATLEARIGEQTTVLNRLLSVQKQCAEIQRRRDVLTALREVMSKKNLQRVLLRSAVSRVNVEVEKAVELFQFRYRLYLDEDCNVLYSSDSQEAKPSCMLSGGERYSAAVIMRLAFSRVLNTDFPFIVLDEPSICLDENSSRSMAGMLRAVADKLKQRGVYMIVPTHDSEVAKAAERVVEL